MPPLLQEDATRIDQLEDEVCELKEENYQLKLKIRQRDKQIRMLEKRVETKCEGIDASHMRLPCFNKVCTHVCNDQYDEDEVVRAIGKEGVEKERMLKLKYDGDSDKEDHASESVFPEGQRKKASRGVLDRIFRFRRQGSLGEQIMTASKRRSNMEEPMGELSLGESSLAVPQEPSTRKVSNASLRHPERPCSSELPGLRDELKDPSERVSPSGQLFKPLFGKPKVLRVIEKATPSSLGFFRQPAYLEEVKENVRNIMENYQRKYPRGTIKEKIELLSPIVPEGNLSKDILEQFEGFGKELDALDIKKAREKYEAYSPAWEEEDELIEPVLKLSKMFWTRKDLPGTVPKVEHPTFTLGPPALPIPLALIVDELLTKVEKDGVILRTTKEFVRKTQSEIEMYKTEIRSLHNKISTLKKEETVETAKQTLERMRQENERLRREGQL